MCAHLWRQVHEELLIGGHFPVGWRCTECGKFVGHEELTPAGLTGVVTKEHELTGPHGGRGKCSDGSTYVRQIVRSDGSLEIER